MNVPNTLLLIKNWITEQIFHCLILVFIAINEDVKNMLQLQTYQLYANHVNKVMT